jgi:predicted DCC family thiol-disulfide oxidoreductase YuxK
VKHHVFYDSLCPVCRRSRRLLERLDWRGRLEFMDIHDREVAEAALPDVTYADMLREMYVKRADGRHFAGYFALRALAPALPLLWPLVPLMWLPGAAWLGRRVYAWVARNRFKRAACDEDDVCSLHLQLLAGRELDDEIIAQFTRLREKQPGK